MIQGGDPNTKNNDRSNHGMGGPGYSIKAEFNDTLNIKRCSLHGMLAGPLIAVALSFIVFKDVSF